MVGNIVTSGIKNTTDLLFRRQTSITSAAFVIIFLTLASRLLGLIRYRVLAGEFGVTTDLAAFLTAFIIPDTIFQIVVVGALSTAFIPVIAMYLTNREEAEVSRIFSIVVSFALVATAIFTVVVFIFAHPIAIILAPRLPDSAHDLTANMLRVMMVGQFFIIISGFVTGLLNSYHRFLIPAIAPLIYNLGIIFGTIFLSPSLGIYGPVAGVVIGAIGHLLIQIPLMRRLGVKFSFNLNFYHPAVQRIAQLTAPRTLGISVAQLEPMIDNALATLITSTSAETNITVLRYAFLLQGLPAGVFGYALGTAALPTLSKEFTKENLDNFKATLTASLHQIMYLVIPTTVVLVVLRIPIVRLAFGAAKFDWEATQLTALILAISSIGIIGQACIQLLARAFYAIQDTKTPVNISVFTVFLNVLISVVVVFVFNNIILMGLAASIGGMVSAILMFYFLSKRIGGFDWGNLLVPIFKMGVAGFLSGLSLYTPLKILDSASYGQLWSQGSIVHTFLGAYAIDTSHTIGLLILTLISGVLGLIVYILVTYVLAIEEIVIFTRLLGKFRLRKIISNLDKQAVAEPTSGSSNDSL